MSLRHTGIVSAVCPRCRSSLLSFLLPLFCLLLALAPNTIFALSADEILKKVDEIRNPQEDYTVDIRVQSLKPDKPPQESVFRVMVGGAENALVQSVMPLSDRGRVLLMKGPALWIYLPTISKPLRIPLRERLLGEVSNADVARVNLSGDYSAEVEKIESNKDGDFYLLNLTARSAEIPYARIRLWAEKNSFRPFQAEFYAVSGRLLKTCLYRNFKPFGGRLRPTRLIMSDPLIKGQYTSVEYENIDLHAIPEKYFNDDYLRKLSRS